MTIPALFSRVSLALLAAAAVTATPPVWAQTPSSAASDAPSPVTFRWREHPGLRVGRHVRLDFTARLEAERRAEPLDAETDWARRRIGVQGQVSKRVEFTVERELSDESSPWRDVYVNAVWTDAFEVRAGHFKLPFGAEQLTGAADLPFAQRAMMSDALAPGRDTGVMGHGKVWHRRLAYRVGYFTQDGRQARTRTTAGGRDAVAARIVVSPFRPDGRGRTPWSGITVGGGLVTSTLHEGALGLDGRTALFERRFFDAMYVSGRRRRMGADLAWSLPRLTIAVEGMRVRDARANQSIFDDSLPAVVSDGWVGTTVWTLRGGRRWRGEEGPRLGVFDARVGAIELAARAEALRFSTPDGEGRAFLHPRSPSIPTVAARATTLGVNWYPLPMARLQVDAVRERVSVSAGGVPGGGRPSWGSHVRLQVLF